MDETAKSDDLAPRLDAGRTALRASIVLPNSFVPFLLLNFGVCTSRTNSLDRAEGRLKNLPSGFFFAYFALFAASAPNPNFFM